MLTYVHSALLYTHTHTTRTHIHPLTQSPTLMPRNLGGWFLQRTCGPSIADSHTMYEVRALIK